MPTVGKGRASMLCLRLCGVTGEARVLDSAVCSDFQIERGGLGRE